MAAGRSPDYDLWSDCTMHGLEDDLVKASSVDLLFQEIMQNGQAKPTVKSTIEPRSGDQDDSSVTSEASNLKFKCETCCQVFDSKIALSIHTGRIHKADSKDKSYQCKLCSKAFFNSSYLAQHMRIHTGHKPYACSQCDKRFTQLSHLQQHKRTHTGEKPYQCPHPGCTKAFSQLSNLQSHSRSHLLEGNVHKCSSCYKCYSDAASLVIHMKSHTESRRVRNYRCGVCGKCYTQDTYLQNHINTKHGSAVACTLTTTHNPTSIQAATNLVCKVEDSVGAKRPSCDATPPLPRLPSVPQPSPVHDALLSLLPTGKDGEYRFPELNRDLCTEGYRQPADTYIERNAPYHRQDIMEGFLDRSTQFDRQDAKQPIEDEFTYQEGIYWRSNRGLMNSACLSSGLIVGEGSYPYSQGGYEFPQDKSNLYDTSNDYYLMASGFRDAYMMD